jgi:hypothetical protein
MRSRQLRLLLAAVVAIAAASVITFRYLAWMWAERRAAAISSAREVLRNPWLATLVADAELVPASVETPDARRLFDLVDALLVRDIPYDRDSEPLYVRTFSILSREKTYMSFGIGNGGFILRGKGSEAFLSYGPGDEAALGAAFEKWHKSSAPHERQ